MAGLLALLDHGTEEKLTVESHCLAHVFRLIDRSAVNICAILDEFIGIGEARAAVAESTNQGCE